MGTCKKKKERGKGKVFYFTVSTSMTATSQSKVLLHATTLPLKLKRSVYWESFRIQEPTANYEGKLLLIMTCILRKKLKLKYVKYVPVKISVSSELFHV